jgi:hypothetical protein
MLILLSRLKDHINKNHPKDVLSLDEFLALRQEVLKENAGEGAGAPGEEDVPPGEEDLPPGEADENKDTSDTAGGDAAAAAAKAAKAAVSVH